MHRGGGARRPAEPPPREGRAPSRPQGGANPLGELDAVRLAEDGSPHHLNDRSVGENARAARSTRGD